MDIDNLTHYMGPGIDYKEIPAIHQKRTLAFINHFIGNTVSLMNNLSRSCEIKLQKYETQLQRMDACLCILEAKLKSIPGLEGDPEIKSVPAVIPPATQEPCVASKPQAESVTQETQDIPQQKDTPPVATTPGASQDPRYAKFFRMVHVGVPPQAVKLKMQAEGLDPSILDNPNAAPPPAPSPASDADSETSNDTPSD